MPTTALATAKPFSPVHLSLEMRATQLSPVRAVERNDGSSPFNFRDPTAARAFSVFRSADTSFAVIECRIRLLPLDGLFRQSLDEFANIFRSPSRAARR